MAASSIFTFFLEGWHNRHQHFLRQLESLLSPTDGFDTNHECGEIIPRIFSHYEELNREKTKLAHEDVFILISPPWLSSFERSLLWISGFRPSIIFPLMEQAVEDISALQREKIEAVKAETRRKERDVTQAMARVQESVAEPPVYSLMRKFGNLVDGEKGEFDAGIEALKSAMVVVVGNADALQGWTASEVVKILSPVQGVQLLAAVTRFEVQARKLGVAKDRERERMAAEGAVNV